MDPHRDEVMEFILDLSEVELGRKRDETRDMEEQLRTERVVMEAKEKERLRLIEARDHMLSVKNAMDKLVANFLEAEGNNNFDAQKAMKNEIVALMMTDGSDGSNAEGSGGGVNGGDIGYLENTKNKDARAGKETIVGKNDDNE